jgi:hypothetical protein
VSYNELAGRRQRRAARLRERADRLDPDGAVLPMVSGEHQVHATWEECCSVHYFNNTGVGAPLFYRAGDAHRLTGETTRVETENHHGEPLP